MPPAAALGVALAATVISTGVSIIGQQQQKKAIKQTAEFNAKVLENEALAREDERAENTRRERIRNRRLTGRQRTLIAKGGVTETGSPLELMALTAGELELNVLDLNRAAEAKKQQLRAKAGITRFEGASLAQGLTFKQFGTGIGGIAQGAPQTASLIRALK